MNVFSASYKLRPNDFDCHDNILPNTILDIFQDVAGEHAKEMKVGYNDLIKQNIIWIVLRIKYTLITNPQLHSIVKATTWPKKPGKIDADRDYLICDENNNILVKGTSKWIICDYSTRRILKLNGINYGSDFIEKNNYETTFDKLEDFNCDSLQPIETSSCYMDLDHNGHVNNAKYINYILNSIVELREKNIKELQIDYVHEIMVNEKISIYFIKKDNCYYVKGINHYGKLNFISKIETY